MALVLADLELQLAEVEGAISDLTGAVDQSVGGFSTSIGEAYQRLVSQRADLLMRISVINNGGSSGDNCTSGSMGAE